MAKGFIGSSLILINCKKKTFLFIKNIVESTLKSYILSIQVEKNWEVFYFGLKKGREQYSVCCYCEWYEGISLRSSSWLQHRKEKSGRKMPTDPRPSSDMKRCSWNGYLKVISRKPHLFHNIIWYKNTYTDSQMTLN